MPLPITFKSPAPINTQLHNFANELLRLHATLSLSINTKSGVVAVPRAYTSYKDKVR